MKKILFLTTNRVFPINSGAARYSTSILKYLKENNNHITLVNFYSDKPSNHLCEQSTIKKYCNVHYEIKLEMKNNFFNISFKYPLTVKKYFRVKMIELIKKITTESMFDVVVFDHLHMATYSEFINCDKKVLIEHNVETEIWKSYLLKTKGIKKLIISKQVKKFYEFEKNQLSKFDMIFTISKEDKENLNKMDNEAKISVLHPILEMSKVKNKEQLLKTTNSILFVGDMSWFPNQEAADYLIYQLMPLLRKENADIRLYIVGNKPSTKLLEVSKKFSDITVTGRVESIDPYYSECDIFINSIFSGSGLNIKIIEAMSKGIPVISSKFGSRGFEVANLKNESMLIFEDVKDLKNKIMYLLENSQKRIQLTENATVLCEKFMKPDNKFNQIFN